MSNASSQQALVWLRAFMLKQWRAAYQAEAGRACQSLCHTPSRPRPYCITQFRRTHHSTSDAGLADGMASDPGMGMG
eukprot:1161921-Pelagomonas_calceolata.AAC.15